MDWTILDVTDVPNAQIDDEVVLIGGQNGLQISAEDIAAELDTISYEITCAIDRRVPRVYNGKVLGSFDLKTGAQASHLLYR